MLSNQSQQTPADCSDLTPSHNKLLTPEDVAELLGVTRLLVVRKSRLGTIPAIKLGKSWRYRLATIQAWLAQQEGVRA